MPHPFLSSHQLLRFVRVTDHVDDGNTCLLFSTNFSNVSPRVYGPDRWLECNTLYKTNWSCPTWLQETVPRTSFIIGDEVRFNSVKSAILKCFSTQTNGFKPVWCLNGQTERDSHHSKWTPCRVSLADLEASEADDKVNVSEWLVQGN